MSYCVGLKLDKGLVFMADTLTNAGVDNISQYQKIYSWSEKGKAQLFLLTAGNLATSQVVVSDLNGQGAVDKDLPKGILSVPNMFQAAKLAAETLRRAIVDMQGQGQEATSAFDVTMILGGQIAGGDMQLFLIYPEGNFIEVSDDQPFFQIGETKYGKPTTHIHLMNAAEFLKPYRLRLPIPMLWPNPTSALGLVRIPTTSTARSRLA